MACSCAAAATNLRPSTDEFLARSPSADDDQHIIDIDDPIAIDIAGQIARLAPGPENLQKIIDTDDVITIDVGRTR